ncbi:hypothetical protein [Harryflintia acetispora]|uniref:hypothetical protein n=1 Tax=Harryflintia acetispora TaxID=1849041 RepID=UPI00189B3276|nr:hypothetical protein [Harryflintia acetispora]
MSKRRVFAAALFLCLLPSVPVRAAGGGVTVTVQDGYSCDYGVDVPFTRSERTGSYTFSLFPGEAVSGAPEVTAAVEITAAKQVNVHLPLRYDLAGPSTWTLQVTAHVAPGREAFDREASATGTFTTAPTCGCPAGTAGAYYAGNGASYPYLIQNQAQLAHMQNHLGSSLRLENDLALSGSWTSTGTFTGVFDGGGHTISGLDSTTGGLFSVVSGSDARVKNVTINRPVISASYYMQAPNKTHNYAAGGIVNQLLSGAQLLDCTVSGADLIVDGVSSSYGETFSTVGAVAGWAEYSSLLRCKAVGGTVAGTSKSQTYLGGIVGLSYDCTFAECLSSAGFGASTGPNGIATGGIVGAEYYASTLNIFQNCHWTNPAGAIGWGLGGGVNVVPNTGESFGNSQVSSIG